MSVNSLALAENENCVQNDEWSDSGRAPHFAQASAEGLTLLREQTRDRRGKD
jgi:hypothetical protein